jgi:hypothetical protein
MKFEPVWALVVGAAAACGNGSSGPSSPSSNCDGVGLDFGACVCTSSQPPIRPVAECSEQTMGAGILCCQRPGGECFCAKIGCDKPSAGSDFCSCNFAGQDMMTCTGAICCNTVGKNAGQCSCGPSACTSEEVQVPSCTNDVLQCATGETRVPKCTSQ